MDLSPKKLRAVEPQGALTEAQLFADSIGHPVWLYQALDEFWMARKSRAGAICVNPRCELLRAVFLDTDNTREVGQMRVAIGRNGACISFDRLRFDGGCDEIALILCGTNDENDLSTLCLSKVNAKTQVESDIVVFAIDKEEPDVTGAETHN